MDKVNEVFDFLPVRVKEYLYDNSEFKRIYKGTKLNEIRLRVNTPLSFILEGDELIIKDLIIGAEDIEQCIQFITNYSLYAYENQIGQGFVTLKGGHRAGITGQAILEGKNIVNQKNIAFINIRVAHEIVGCANEVVEYMKESMENTLIIAPPGCGKTTLLRDLIRQLSEGCMGRGYKIGLVDERSEIAACFEGIPQNNVGIRTDVLDQAPKSEGMMLLLRSMSPEIICVDELAGKADADAVKYIFGCGCKVIATVHGLSLEQVKRQPFIGDLIGEFGFRNIITLSRGMIKSMERV